MPIAYTHLNQQERAALDGFVKQRLITKADLPVQDFNGYGKWIGLDSMGPMRDPKTDRLFPDAEEALYVFSTTMRDYDLSLVVATNGPDVEGTDILRALSHPARAFAVTQGGGKVIYFDQGKQQHLIYANPEELDKLAMLEDRVGRNPLMKMMLEDKQNDGRDAPIRTPYETNVVLTFPNSYETLRARAGTKAAEVDSVVQQNGANWLDAMLGYADSRFKESIVAMGLAGLIKTLVKKPNRRLYVMPMHLVDGSEFNKTGGASLGADMLHSLLGYPPYSISNSIYVADRLVDTTGEGQRILGVSERSMVSQFAYDIGKMPEGVKVIKLHHAPESAGDVIMADVGCRLGINVTMDDSPPRLETVEGVPVLHVGSGVKALEAIAYLYERLYN